MRGLRVLDNTTITLVIIGTLLLDLVAVLVFAKLHSF
jgi:hypothetical protein